MQTLHLPKFILSYASAILSAPWRFTLVYLSLKTGISHDVFTRGLQKRYPWKELLKSLTNKELLDNGYLIFDETDIDKSFAGIIQGLSWLFSHRKNKYIFGYHLVVIAWTNNTITIPLAWKIYQKDSGKTKIDLALELIQYCLSTLNIHPKAWLFDSFYSAEDILKFLNEHNQKFYSQLQKNRLLDFENLKNINNGRPYWTKTGLIKGKIEVQVVKNRRKYYVTNDLGVPRQEQLATYKIRWKIEEIFRFVKQSLGFERCQSQSLIAQHNHFGICFWLYGILQDNTEKTQLTDYRQKLEATFDPMFVEKLNLSSYFTGA
jgi:putative transposase